MKFILQLLLFTLTSTWSFAHSDTTNSYHPKWVFSPLNLGVSFFLRENQNLNDSLKAAGYSKESVSAHPTFIALEVYNKTYFTCSYAFCFTGKTSDTSFMDKGRYNMLKEAHYANHSISIGYNVFPIEQVPQIALTPKIGFYISRLKIKTTNYDGDTLFMQSVYSNNALETKTIRRWESGIQLGLKIDIPPFKNASLFSLIGFGVEAGLQHNINLWGKSLYDNGKQSISMPVENKNNYYFKMNIVFGRGLITKN